MFIVRKHEGFETYKMDTRWLKKVLICLPTGYTTWKFDLYHDGNWILPLLYSYIVVIISDKIYNCPIHFALAVVTGTGFLDMGTKGYEFGFFQSLSLYCDTQESLSLPKTSVKHQRS